MKKNILFALLLAAFFAIATPTSSQQTGSANLSGSGTACLSTGATPNCLSVPIQPLTTTASVAISGTFSATVQFETSGDQGNTFQAQSMNPSGGGSGASSATAPGLWTACVSPLNVIRARVSALVSGTAVVTINTSAAEVASCGSSAGAGVTSFSGDGSLLSNSGSTGAVTATVGSAGAHKAWGNNTGSPATGSFVQFACADLSNAAASCSTDATNGSNIASGTINQARLPATSTQTIANGTSALGTSLIGSGACASTVTTTATGTATTDDIIADFNADPTSTTGYSPSANGMLTIIKFPTSGNVNFKVCNNTAAGITPGGVTLNWRVVR